jgi:hypothetical protein
VDNRQHDIDLDFTACENASLCAFGLRVSYSHRFGHFDSKEMHSSLSESKIFAETLGSKIPDAHEWSLCITAWIPVGLPNDHLVLCLDGCGWRNLKVA